MLDRKRNVGSLLVQQSLSLKEAKEKYLSPRRKIGEQSLILWIASSSLFSRQFGLKLAVSFQADSHSVRSHRSARGQKERYGKKEE